MPRYENVEGRSAKFWEIELDGASLTTRQGRIQSDGRRASSSPAPIRGSEPESTSTKRFKTADEARLAYEMAIFDKLDKGYQLVDPEAEAAAAAEELPKAPAPTSTNP